MAFSDAVEAAQAPSGEYSGRFDVGVDLGSPVSQAYADQRLFPFTGRIWEIQVTQ